MKPILHGALTEKIIKCFYNVYNTLGYGFLEKVYENSMMLELKKEGLSAVKQESIKVYYLEEQVGDYYTDIIVENKVILELKAAETLALEHEFQLLNYLRATEAEVGLLLNFGKAPQFRRLVFTNDKKGKIIP
jgi:GxxExxY protein